MGGSADPWRRERARVAAGSVFSLAHEDPVLRPEATETIERVATMLPLRDGPIPRRAVEEVVASMAAGEVARLVFRAEERAPQRWRALVDEVGGELAQEPLLAGIATAAIEELLPPPLWLVVMREATADAAPGPIDVLATLLEPQTVWSLSEAGAAWADFRRGSLPDGLTAVQCFAQSKITSGTATEHDTWLARSVDCCQSPRLLVLRASFAMLWTSFANGGARQSFASAYCLARWPGLKGLVPIAPSSN